MEFSSFGRKVLEDCGILQLMDDLGNAVAEGEGVIMLGGGNPSHIPEVEACLRERMQAMLDDGQSFEAMVGNYAPPQGHKAFTTIVADLLSRELGWPVSAQNIALTNGSQTAFFFLFNLLAGDFGNGRRKRILLPLTPEYIGYTDAGIGDDFFVSYRPEIEHLDDRFFKYRVDFDALKITPDIGAICVSRPTNPTGNVLTNREIAHLHALATEHDIPLIIDNAYGAPFPGIQYVEADPIWDEQIVYCLSLSKLGLPGARTGIVVAREEIIEALAGLNAVVSLAPGNLGAYLAADLMRSGEVLRLSEKIIRPHYQAKIAQAVEWLREEMGDIDYYIHKPEGTFFLWLWFKGLSISSDTLYERLKQQGVLVVPGHYFYPGLENDDWEHRYECIRMNVAQPAVDVRQGIRTIARVVAEAQR